MAIVSMLYGAGGASSAEDVSYDNTTSGLEADNVQDALDEVNDKAEERLKPIDPSRYDDVISSVTSAGGQWTAPKTGWLAIRGAGNGQGDPAVSVYAGAYSASNDFPIASQQSAIAGAWQGICVPVKKDCLYTIIAARSTINRAILYY